MEKLAKPVIWEMSDADLCAELSRIEYWFGMKQSDGTIKPYPTADSKDRALGLIAGALRRILENMHEQEVKKRH